MPFAEYVGRQERVTDRIDRRRLASLAALFDADLDTIAPDGAMPPLAQWLHFNVWAKQSMLGEDGHPKRGGFLPPVTLPRRMFAGGRVTFKDALYIDETVERVATIADIREKTGSSGQLIFVTLKHEIFGPRGLAIEEEQDIVYRDAAPSSPVAKPSAPPKDEGHEVPSSAVVKRIEANSVMLFRFSAITDNGHRIHYDHPYVTQVEGYPGLIVHGPLQAMLLADLARTHFPGTLKRFSFRALKPLFEGPFECVGWRDGNCMQLMTRETGAKHACMSAEAEF